MFVTSHCQFTFHLVSNSGTDDLVSYWIRHDERGRGCDKRCRRMDYFNFMGLLGDVDGVDGL